MAYNIYESDELVNQYLLFHYGEEKDVCPWPFAPKEALNFPQRCVEEGLDLARLPQNARALDVGCSVGRSTFELARYCPSAIGIDYSDAFIFAARILCREKELRFQSKMTGTIEETLVARIPNIDCSRVHFEQGDAQDLRPSLQSVDVVLACNLLCRLAEPKLFLSRLTSLVKPGGQVIITTPNSWLEEFTAKTYWIGATPETGEPLEALETEMKPAFRLDRAWDIPFLIREHSRKYQWSVAQASRWIRQPH